MYLQRTATLLLCALAAACGPQDVGQKPLPSSVPSGKDVIFTDSDDTAPSDSDVPGDPDPEPDPEPEPPPPAPAPDGSWANPFTIDALPATLEGDTSASSVSEADSYSPCAPSTNESGPEVVYSLVAPDNGMLAVTVDDKPGDGIDVDVQILSQADPQACLARANTTVTYSVTAGTSYWIVVDSWSNGSEDFPGPYVLTVSFTAAGVGCPTDMVDRGSFCIDRYEAPNRQGALPLVMYTFYQAEAWCAARGKRLCYDDEWTSTCAGEENTAYPYGSFVSGICNDDKLWRTYDQSKLNLWPPSVCSPTVESLDELLNAAAAVSASGAEAAAHVSWLYQGEGGGGRSGCTNSYGVFDLTGNVEEWTRRRDGGSGPDFSGNLKGRYWAEPRTCQSGVTTHGNAFRFYEIGFRCCRDLP